MNLFYPQVKQNTAAFVQQQQRSAPLITFDLHYSSDEEMTGSGGTSKHKIGVKVPVKKHLEVREE